MRRNERHTGECFIESVAIVVVDLNKFMVVFVFLSIVEPRAAGLKEGRKHRERAFLPTPQIQIF
jgi:hypothetical protein